MDKMAKDKLVKWLKVSGLSAIGGGVASSVGALADPTKYSFPKDLGTGRMWPFFLQGAGLTFVAMLLKSPLGVKILSSVKESQAQLQESQQAVTEAKQGFTAPTAWQPTSPPQASQPTQYAKEQEEAAAKQQQSKQQGNPYGQKKT